MCYSPQTILTKMTLTLMYFGLIDLRKKQVLKWPQRMAISIGIARGTQFLHTGVVPAIFGNNLQIDKILLDDNLNPKVSGYNIPLLDDVARYLLSY